LLEACGVSAPRNVKLDGRSLMPLFRNPAASWQDRTLFFQWHRGDAPELYRACAARTQRWKLINGKELYDLQSDPAESRDTSAEHPDIVAKLRSEYEAWFRDVSSRGYAPPRIHIGAPHENPVILTRQDWRGPRAGWDAKSLGHWEVLVAREAEYGFKVQFAPAKSGSLVRLTLNGARLESKVPAGATECLLGKAHLARGEGRLEAEIQADGTTAGVHYVTVSWT
jgi:hypothetical protein